MNVSDKPIRILCLISFLAVIGHALAADWPQFLGPNGDGSSPESIRTNWSELAPREIWRKSIGPGFSSIAAVGDRLYTLVRRSNQGEEREFCVALDARTGDELWSADVDVADYDDNGYNRAMDGPRSTPTVDGDRVYVFTGHLKLTCLQSSDGALVWSRDFVAELNSQVIGWQNAASPLLVGDLIFFNANASGQCLMAVRKLDGTTVWSNQDDVMTHATPVFARIADTPQVIFLTLSGLVSVIPETGAVLWRLAFRPSSVSTASSPVVAGNYVYATSPYGSGAWGGNVVNNGDEFVASLAWRQQGNSYQGHWSTPVVDQGFLYGVPSPSSPQARLTCLDVKTGVNRWTQTTVGSRSIGFGSVIKCANALIVLTEAGELVLVEPNPTAYRELARKSVLSLYCWNHVTLANGRLYARSTSSSAQLVALDVTPVSAPLPSLKLVAERGVTPDALSLTIRAADGTSLDTNQLGRVELLSTTNLLLPLEQWSVLNPPFNARDGVGKVELPWDLEPARFLQAREKAPGN
jgi:outer membrane protein assembly factor BamB